MGKRSKDVIILKSDWTFKMTEIYDPIVAEERIGQLHETSLRVSIAATGAGLGIQNRLWQIAGTSRSLIDAVNPYDQAAFDRFVGRDWGETGYGYASPLGATALAQRAFFQAQEIGVEGAAGDLVDTAGLGLSAAVSTDRERRGENKVHAAIRTIHGIETVDVRLGKELGRQDDGAVSDLIGLNLILHAARVPQIPFHTDSGIESPQLVARDGGWIFNPQAPELPGVGEQETVLIGLDGSVTELELDPERHIIVPGSFNPLQYGHDRIAQAVYDITGKEPVLEITARNIEKAGVGLQDLAVRALQMRGRWQVILTGANTRFTDKVEAYGGCSFAVGHDTAERIIDPAYYGDSAEGVQTALQQFSEQGVIFHVVGRRNGDGELQTVADLALPEQHGGLFVPLPGEFNISSSAIRTALGQR